MKNKGILKFFAGLAIGIGIGFVKSAATGNISRLGYKFSRFLADTNS